LERLRRRDHVLSQRGRPRLRCRFTSRTRVSSMSGSETATLPTPNGCPQREHFVCARLRVPTATVALPQPGHLTIDSMDETYDGHCPATSVAATQQRMEVRAGATAAAVLA